MPAHLTVLWSWLKGSAEPEILRGEGVLVKRTGAGRVASPFDFWGAPRELDWGAFVSAKRHSINAARHDIINEGGEHVQPYATFEAL